MSTLVPFISSDQKKIYVNPEQVTRIQEDLRGEISIYLTGTGINGPHFVTVQGEVDEVAASLSKAE